MVRVFGLAILCAGLSTSHAARNLRRPTQSVAPQAHLSVDDRSEAQQKQVKSSALLRVKTGVASYLFPHFLQRLVSTKKIKEMQPPAEATDDGVGKDTNELCLFQFCLTSGGQFAMMSGAEAFEAYILEAVQLLFGVLYYFLIVRKYPELGEKEANEATKELQAKNEVLSLVEVSPRNCVLSCCCTGPRAAQTFSITGAMNYWLGLFAMTCFPCCTLMCVNSCTEMNEKLGGSKRNIVMSCLCALCCSCCVVAQDAEALDLMSGVQTGFFGVYDLEAKKETEEAQEETAKA